MIVFITIFLTVVLFVCFGFLIILMKKMSKELEDEINKNNRGKDV